MSHPFDVLHEPFYLGVLHKSLHRLNVSQNNQELYSHNWIKYYQSLIIYKKLTSEDIDFSNKVLVYQIYSYPHVLIS